MEIFFAVMFSLWTFTLFAASAICSVTGEENSGTCDMETREAVKLANKNILKIKNVCGEVCQTDLR